MKSNLPPEQLAKILGQTDSKSKEADADCPPPPRPWDARTLPPPQRVTITAVNMPWAETFMLCLKWAICAIPAIWIAYVAYAIPAAIFRSAGDASTAASR